MEAPWKGKPHTYYIPILHILKRFNQAKIHPKAEILFWLLGMSIILCEHVHRLKLRKSLKCWIVVATWQVYRRSRLSVIPVFLILDMHV